MDDEKRALKRRRLRRRILVYGSIAGLLWAFYVWIPWEFDWTERKPPSPHPMVDPDSEKLFSKGTKIAVVTAHPDDSEFYIGGTLLMLARAGAELHHVLLTDGGKDYYPFGWGVPPGLKKTRQTEQREASGRWDVQSMAFLGFPDGRLRSNDQTVAAVVNALRRIQPEYVLAFDGDWPPRRRHQDHRQSGEIVEEAVKHAPSVKWLMRFSTSAPNYVLDITDLWEEKRELVAIHESQFSGERLERVLNLVASISEDAGEKIGVALGEGFRCTKLR